MLLLLLVNCETLGKSPDLFLHWENRSNHGLFSKAAEEQLCKILTATQMLATQAMYRLAVLILKMRMLELEFFFQMRKLRLLRD